MNTIESRNANLPAVNLKISKRVSPKCVENAALSDLSENRKIGKCLISSVRSPFSSSFTRFNVEGTKKISGAVKPFYDRVTTLFANIKESDGVFGEWK